MGSQPLLAAPVGLAETLIAPGFGKSQVNTRPRSGKIHILISLALRSAMDTRE